jgi:hypothetical protein
MRARRRAKTTSAKERGGGAAMCRWGGGSPRPGLTGRAAKQGRRRAPGDDRGGARAELAVRAVACPSGPWISTGGLKVVRWRVSVKFRLLCRPESKKAASGRFLVFGRSSCGVQSGLECSGAACPRRRGLCSEQRQGSGRN